MLTLLPGYLVILSTLQVVIVNPMCIMLLEWGKSEVEARHSVITDSPGLASERGEIQDAQGLARDVEWTRNESIDSPENESVEEPRRSIAVTVRLLQGVVCGAATCAATFIMLLQVLRGVATSPLVVGSVAGVVINLSCGRHCLTSGLAGSTLQVLCPHITDHKGIFKQCFLCLSGNWQLLYILCTFPHWHVNGRKSITS